MSLNAQVATAQRLAEKRGNELYGFEVRDDGSVRGMERPKGLGQVLADALATVEPEVRKIGRGGVVRPTQGALDL